MSKVWWLAHANEELLSVVGRGSAGLGLSLDTYFVIAVWFWALSCSPFSSPAGGGSPGMRGRECACPRTLQGSRAAQHLRSRCEKSLTHERKDMEGLIMILVRLMRSCRCFVSLWWARWVLLVWVIYNKPNLFFFDKLQPLEWIVYNGPAAFVLHVPNTQ